MMAISSMSITMTARGRKPKKKAFQCENENLTTRRSTKQENQHDVCSPCPLRWLMFSIVAKSYCKKLT
jgi:hypothetical protein